MRIRNAKRMDRPRVPARLRRGGKARGIAERRSSHDDDGDRRRGGALRSGRRPDARGGRCGRDRRHGRAVRTRRFRTALDSSVRDDSGALVPSDGGGAMDAAIPKPTDWPLLEEAQIGEPVLISDAFSLAEGALWDPCLEALLFTDADTAVIHKLVPPDQISDFRTDSNYANGINFDPQGRLVIAEMGANSSSGRITRLDRDGVVEVVVDKGAGDVALHTTDDLIVRSDGTIYFTDPVFPHGLEHRRRSVRCAADLSPDARGRGHRGEHGRADRTGILLSPDEKHLVRHELTSTTRSSCSTLPKTARSAARRRSSPASINLRQHVHRRRRQSCMSAWLPASLSFALTAALSPRSRSNP